MTCGECGNVKAPGAGFPNHVYCMRFLLHMEKREDASRCRYFIPKPLANADRVRAMTDEELAEFLLNRDLDVVEKASKAVGFTYKVDIESCLVNVIGWLKEEVAE